MQLENKKFVLENLSELTVKTIEDFISKLGYNPLRWAVVKVEGRKLTIESTCIKLN